MSKEPKKWLPIFDTLLGCFPVGGPVVEPIIYNEWDRYFLIDARYCWITGRGLTEYQKTHTIDLLKQYTDYTDDFEYEPENMPNWFIE